MVTRRPPKPTQRYQPLPKDQNVIIVTDKTQLIPKDISVDDFKNPESASAAKPGEASQKAASKPVKTIQAVDRDGECKILYSAGKLEAYLSIEPPLNAGKWPTIEDAIQQIEAENIVNYDQNAVAEAIERHKTMPVTIAQGKPAVKGRDTEIEFFYELKDLRKIFIEGLIVDSFGRVDYHQVKTVQTVNKGDIIAKKSTCTPGEDGIDVQGQMIKATPGVDKPIKLGKNVAWDEESQNIIATEGGKPTLSSNILSVLPIHEIRSDVNFHTGNIIFRGNVVIYGNVESGFKVNAEGDIVILGNVDAAEIICGGKLSIKGRVFGNDKGVIRCADDFFAKEIEHVTLVCNKNITIHDAIMHSNVTAEGKVTVETGRGWIVGGVVRAGEEISARRIGSKVGTITIVELGSVFKPQISDADNISIENESEGYSTDNPVETISQIIPEPDPTPMDESTQTLKPQGRIRFKDYLHSGVRVCFSFYKFIIQDDLTFGTLTCSEGHLHLLPYR